MIAILGALTAGLLTYGFLYACNWLGCWLEKRGLGDPPLRQAQSPQTTFSGDNGNCVPAGSVSTNGTRIKRVGLS
jgi:hypothetical protein